MKRFALIPLISLGLLSIGCTGDTDGGSAADNALDPGSYVSDGAAGGTLTLNVKDSDNTIGVGDTVGFSVVVTDARGAPAPGVRIFCDSEKGVAILEPANNNISVEMTDSEGQMSGQIGGVTPGSYIFECRAQDGFNLVGRTTIKISGEVTNGFQGFPGAAGGNLGGGRVIDTTPDVDDGVGLRISAVSFQDAGGESTQGPIDTEASVCVNGLPDLCAVTCNNEPFAAATYKVTVKNDTNENIFISTVEFRSGGTTVVAAQGQVGEIAKGGGTGILTGFLTTFINCADDTCFNLGNGSSSPIQIGSRNYEVIVTGTSEGGNSFEVSKDISILFQPVNNCSGGTALSSCPTRPASCDTTTTTT